MDNLSHFVCEATLYNDVKLLQRLVFAVLKLYGQASDNDYLACVATVILGVALFAAVERTGCSAFKHLLARRILTGACYSLGHMRLPLEVVVVMQWNLIAGTKKAGSLWAPAVVV